MLSNVASFNSPHHCYQEVLPLFSWFYRGGNWSWREKAIYLPKKQVQEIGDWALTLLCLQSVFNSGSWGHWWPNPILCWPSGVSLACRVPPFFSSLAFLLTFPSLHVTDFDSDSDTCCQEKYTSCPGHSTFHLGILFTPMGYSIEPWTTWARLPCFPNFVVVCCQLNTTN